MVFCLFCTLLSVNCLFLSVNCKDARVISLKPRCACTGVVLWLNDPPQYGAEHPVDVRFAPTEAERRHKSGMIIPRYANTGEDCGSATHGTIRRHHSWGLLTPTSFYYNTSIFTVKSGLCQAEQNFISVGFLQNTICLASA